MRRVAIRALSGAAAWLLASTARRAADTTDVQVRGTSWASPRGLGDVPDRARRHRRLAAPADERDALGRAGLLRRPRGRRGPRQRRLPARLRPRPRLGHRDAASAHVPINVPMHIHGQGYADVNFIIPEVVRSIRVLEGPYDPRQGDAAIVGSALLRPRRRRARLPAQDDATGRSTRRASWASRRRAEADEETFAAFSLRETHGFGQDRASQSASLNAQYGVDLGPRDHLRVARHGLRRARRRSPGVVRQDDVNAGRIGYYDAYPTHDSGAASPRAPAGAGRPVGARHRRRRARPRAPRAARAFEVAPWLMWTDFRARQNFTGDLESSQHRPAALRASATSSQTTNAETAAGVTARFHARAGAPRATSVEVAVEPGVFAPRRAHRPDQEPARPGATSAVGPPRDARARHPRRRAPTSTSTCALWKKLRISGGAARRLPRRVGRRPPGRPAARGSEHARCRVRVRTSRASRAGPRVTVAYEVAPELSPVVSAGEGFRSLDARSLQPGAAAPYSKVRSRGGPARADARRPLHDDAGRSSRRGSPTSWSSRPPAGGLETESASTRRGRRRLVRREARRTGCSPRRALSVTERHLHDARRPASRTTCPTSPPILFRADATRAASSRRVSGRPVTGRVGVGYTLLGGPPPDRHDPRPDEQRAQRARGGALALRRGRARRVQRAGPEVRRRRRVLRVELEPAKPGSSRRPGRST